MHSTERAAIAATLDTTELMRRVRDVVGHDIGDPLHNPTDSVALREKFDLAVELHERTVFAFNDDGLCAALPLGNVFMPPAIARRAACVAVASMWVPSMRQTQKEQSKAKQSK